MATGQPGQPGQQPQMSAADLAKLVELYKKIDGLTESAAKNAADLAKQNGNAANELSRLQKEWDDLTKGIAGTRESFARIVDDIKGFSSGVNRATTAFKGLESLASKLQYHQSGISRLSAKELETLKKKAQQKLTDLELAKKLADEETRRLYLIRGRSDEDLKAYQEALARSTEINGQINENVSAYKDFNYQLEHNIDIQKQIEESLGAAGALVKGVSKIPFLGDLPGMKDVLQEVEEEIRRIEETEGRVVSKAEAMSMTFKKMGPVIGKGLMDPMTGVVAVLKFAWDVIKGIDAGAGELAKSMNMSYKSALQFRTQFTDIASASNDASLNTKNLQASYMAIGQALGANADINEKDLKTFTKLREQAGYTNEELMGMYKISLTTGKSVEEVTSGFLGGAEALSAQKGLSINVKQLMKETANTSAAIRLSLGGSSKALAEAAVKAKEMGINLDQADKIAGSLLNFEDSISAELEAELLTGKQINLEAARLAAINGDIGTMAEEINSQIGGSAEFTKMNRIQQEAYANAVGMSREDLAESLVQQEALQRVGAKTAEEAKKRYDDLRSKGLTAEQAAVELGDAQLAQQFEQQSNAERFQQAIEKLKDMLVEMMDGPLNKILGVFQTLVENAGLIKFIFAAIAGIMTGKMAIGLYQMVAKLGIALGLSTARAAAEVTAASALTFGAAAFGIIAGLTAVMGVLGAFSGGGKSVQDAQIAPDGGLMVSGPKGTFQLDKDDTVIAGTDLNKKGNSSNQSSSSNVIVKGGETSLTINGEVFARLVTPFIVEELNKRNTLVQ